MTQAVAPHARPVAIAKLRPTQFAVGFAEVERKRAAWRAIKKKARRDYLAGHVVPVVKGPGGLYLIDHHHEARALDLEGQKEVLVQVLAELAHLQSTEFWQEMEARGWCYLRDPRGRLNLPAELPHHLAGLADDPWRSLADAVKDAGGYAKSTQPFAEFRWARFLQFRLRDPGKKETLAEALALAQSNDARHLPGWHPPVVEKAA